jgi:hypothetical protein
MDGPRHTNQRRLIMENEGYVGGAVVIESTERPVGGGIRYGGRRRIARRVTEAMIDEALDRAQARSDQRDQIYRARNRAFTAIDDYLEGRDPALCPLVETELREQIWKLFVSDPVGAAPLDARRAQPDHRRLVETIARSVRDVHTVLTPSQRQLIAGYVRGNLGIDRLAFAL